MSKEFIQFSLRLFQLQHEWRNLLADVLEDEDITPEKWLILNSLKNDNGLTMTELCEQQGIKLPAVSKNVDLLVKSALLYRVNDPKNRRRVLVYLTEFGEKVIMKANRKVKSKISRFNRERKNARWDLISDYMGK